MPASEIGEKSEAKSKSRAFQTEARRRGSKPFLARCNLLGKRNGDFLRAFPKDLFPKGLQAVKPFGDG